MSEIQPTPTPIPTPTIKPLIIPEDQLKILKDAMTSKRYTLSQERGYSER